MRLFEILVAVLGLLVLGVFLEAASEREPPSSAHEAWKRCAAEYGYSRTEWVRPKSTAARLCSEKLVQMARRGDFGPCKVP